MRYLHADYVRRTATRAAHGLMASLVLDRAQRAVAGRVPAGLERRAARYLAVVEGRVPIMHIAAAVGDKRSRIRAGLATIEDARDEAGFDALMDQLGQELTA